MRHKMFLALWARSLALVVVMLAADSSAQESALI